MITFPNAKINIGLNVINKRSDGFHNLETIFYPVDLKDSLEITPSQSIEKFLLRLHGTSQEIEVKGNLVEKVYWELEKSGYKLPSIEVDLLKGIPVGAGLGGGSSDAAFMAKILRDFHSLALTNEELENIVARLGSDCPFFIRNKPVFATEKGGVFENIELNLASYQFVLVYPNIHVNTKEAYSSVVPKKPEFCLKDLIKKPVTEWKNLIMNDFEYSIFEKYPKIRELKESLYAEGAIFSLMSGSGSSVYGIFDRTMDLSLFHKKYKDYFVYVGKFLN